MYSSESIFTRSSPAHLTAVLIEEFLSLSFALVLHILISASAVPISVSANDFMGMSQAMWHDKECPECPVANEE